MASVDLQWELVRKNNAFIVKRNGYTFSTEPTNLANKHSYKFSGLAQNKVSIIIGGIRQIY
jgi:large subunit ribosomal protein L28e